MLRVAIRPKFLGLLVLMLALAAVCGALASWQWDRAHRASQAQQETQTVQPYLELITAEGAVTNATVGALVTVTGEFEPALQAVVPQRQIAGDSAVLLVAALKVDDAKAQQNQNLRYVPVVRGWIKTADFERLTAGGKSISEVWPLPSGSQTVTGYLEASEAASSGVTDTDVAGVHQIGEIATALLINLWDTDLPAGYIAQTKPSVAAEAAAENQQALQPMPRASSEARGALNLQNLGYAVQWVIFAGFFIFIWFTMVRQTYRDEQLALTAAETDTGDSGQNLPIREETQSEHETSPR